MFLENGEKRIYYEAHGQGEPALLFVHGWMGSSAVWREQVPALSKTNQVVTFDLTGYGQSSKPEGMAYTPEVWIDDIDRLIAHLNLEKPILIGWSMGGAIGIAYALNRPGVLSKLVLSGSTPLLVATSDVFEYAIPPEAAESLTEAMQADYSSGARGFVEMMLPEPETDAIKDELHAITQQTTGPIALESLGNAGAADLRPALGNIFLPTLVLHGEADAVCSMGAGQTLAEMIPNAVIKTFPDKGHVPFLTDAETFNQELAAFI